MISIVIPVYNEQDGLDELYRQVTAVMNTVGQPYELVFVNDGSKDASQEVLLHLCHQDPRARVIEFSRNFGHQAAVLAGLDYAQGDAVISMDGDLQHPPELIPELVKRWQAGYDIVYTCRQRTEDAGALRSIATRLSYRLLNAISDVEIRTGTADFRLLDRRVIQTIRRLGEHALFLRGLVSWMGYRQSAVYYDAQARYAGKSKYSLVKLMRLLMNGVVSFSSLPLYAPAFAGLAITTLGFLGALLAIGRQLITGRIVQGWVWVIVVLLALGGLQLVAVGVQGAYLGRIYDEVKARPRYLVRQIYGPDQVEQVQATFREFAVSLVDTEASEAQPMRQS